MTPGFARLVPVAGLILDRDLARLRAAAAARAGTLQQIAGLEAEPPDGPVDIAAAQRALLYRRWADARRRELNLVLARQTADFLTARADAAQAFGRAEVLRRLAER